MKRNKKPWITTAVLLMASAICLHFGPVSGVPFAKWRNFGKPATRAIAGANNVEVFRIAHPMEVGPRPTHLHGYPIMGQGQTQGAGFAWQLRNTLLNEKIHPPLYGRHRIYSKACGFRPGVGFRLHGSGGDVDVLVCYDCAQLGLYDSTDTNPLHIGGFAYCDFDPIYVEMVALAKEAFPHDKEIQSLDAHKFDG
jgi:hypothetical protein